MDSSDELTEGLLAEERPLVDRYEAICDQAESETEERLARQILAAQRFQISALELFASGVPGAFHCFGSITHDDVNIRSGPGSGHERLTTRSRGTPIIIKEYEGYWVHIRLKDGLDGYVFKDYVRCELGGDS